MVRATVQELESASYIVGMCSDHSLVASYSGPNFFPHLFEGLESLGPLFLFENTN